MVQGPEHRSAGQPAAESYYDSIEGLVSVGEPGLDLPTTLDAASNLEDCTVEHAQQLYDAALLFNFKKQYAKAIDHLERACRIYQQKKHFSGVIECLVELAWLKYCHDEADGASKSNRLFVEAMNLINVHMHEPGINELRARVLHYQGLVQYRQKQYGEGVKNFMYAKTFCKPDGLEAARIQDSLGVHYERTNDYYRAIQCLNTSLLIKQKHGCTYEQAITCQIAGRIFILKEEYEKATEYLQQALQVSLELGDFKRCAQIKNDLIRLSIYQQDLETSKTLIREQETECTQRNLPVQHGMALFYKAYIFYNMQNFPKATSILTEQVIPIFTEQKYRKGYAMAVRLLACLEYKNGDDTWAIEQMSEVIAIFKEEGQVTELAKTYYELGRLYLNLNDEKLALDSLMEALKISEENGLSFLTSHIDDAIFRLDEKQWQEIVEKRARHERVFEGDSNLMDALSSLSHENTSTESRSLISLLRVAQAMAAERDLDKLLNLIREETELALLADRCTVFIYDRESNELWSRVATGIDSSEEIRFPAHLGLAGYVVKTGEVLNIKDAYEDPRFNKEIDKKTGYHTHNILCMPVRNRHNEILGVFQVLNKQKGHFDKTDEDLLTAIASNAGVAIENATLAKEIKVSFDSFVKALSSTIDARDPITAGHSERVAEYSELLGSQMSLPTPELECLKYASLLHDIGKVGIREDVLKKDGRLTEKEYRHIQKHVSYTHEILKNVHFERHLRHVPEIAASHHEKMDGSGYHRGLKGSEIHLSGRILAISDVFDAITSRRHYRNRMPFDKVLTILKRDANTHFDPDCVEGFFAIPLRRVSRVLLMDHNNNFEGDLPLLKKLDPSISIGEYYKLMKKDTLTKGEVDVHRIFSKLYHHMEMDDLD